MQRRTFLLAASAAAAGPLLAPRTAPAQQTQITGAGATFPAPVYQRWGEQARQATGLSLNYQGIGSGGGLNQITNRTVDFGASDAPVAADQLRQRRLMQFPTVLGAVVPIVNLPGVQPDQLKLTPEILAEMFLGKLAKWNDRRIQDANPGVSLPNAAVAVVHRADASGTSFVFTSYLSKVSEEWKGKVGAATSVSWPAGTGARGNDGVAATVRNTRGAIGYVENAYAEQNKLATAQLRNRSGSFIKADMQAFQTAAAGADWASAPDFAVDLIDAPGDQSWPIVSPTYILLPTDPQDADKARNVMRFFDWAYANGDAAAAELRYIPLPDQVAARVRQAWAQEVKGPDGQPVWTGQSG